MGYYDKLAEYNYHSTDGNSHRCINCKHIDCRNIKSKGSKIRVHCKELSNYCGKDIYTKFNSICMYYIMGY